MRSLDAHPPTTPSHTPEGETPGGGRLNLLLSCASWRPEPWIDRLPRMLEPMGVTSLRADSAREATAVLQSNPIHIAVVDLGLPMDQGDKAEPAGPRLLDLLRRLENPPPTVVVHERRSTREATRQIAAALRAGAFAAIDRPHDPDDLETLLEVLRRILTRHHQGRWPDPLQ